MLQSSPKESATFPRYLYTSKTTNEFSAWIKTREYELRKPIPHIGLCTYYEPHSSDWPDRRLSRHQNSQLAKSAEAVHMTLVDEDDDLVLEKMRKYKGRNWDL